MRMSVLPFAVMDLFDLMAPPEPLKPENPVAVEIHRRDSNYQKVLDRLRRGPATNAELNEICFRYGARIWEMKKNGITIDKKHVGESVYIYILKGEPT